MRHHVKWAAIAALIYAEEMRCVRQGHGHITGTLRWAHRTGTPVGRVLTYVVAPSASAWLVRHLLSDVTKEGT